MFTVKKGADEMDEKTARCGKLGWMRMRGIVCGIKQRSARVCETDMKKKKSQQKGRESRVMPRVWDEGE